MRFPQHMRNFAILSAGLPMRAIFLTAATLWAAAASCQNGGDCAMTSTAANQAICSNPILRALDQEFESKLNQTWDEVALLDPTTLDRQRQRWNQDVAHCAGPVEENCLLTIYQLRLTFLKNLRISAALEPRLSGGAQLRTLRGPELGNQNLFELLTIHPVLAPLAASEIGMDWIFWAEVGAQKEASLRAVPGGRWLIGRGSIAEKDSQQDLYLALDLRMGELSIVYYHDYTGELYEPFRELRWVTTAPSWPGEASKVLAPLGGKVWHPENARTVGLPSTRLRPLPWKDK